MGLGALRCDGDGCDLYRCKSADAHFALGLKVGPTGLCLGCSGRPTRVARLYIVTLVRRSVGAFPGLSAS